MKNKLEIKHALYRACRQQIEQRIDTIEKRLEMIAESLNSETKSSVGDKYETGRAMMQMEEEKSRAQLLEAGKVKQELLKIDPGKQVDRAEPGSLVTTTNGEYYIAVGIGKIRLDDQVYYCISIDSPIGQQLSHKVVGAEIKFNTVKMKILEIH